MKTKVCPCCDQPISGIYCKGCRKIVWNPVEQDIHYYLNTRHPEDDHSCSFHNDGAGDFSVGRDRKSLASKANLKSRGAEQVRQSDQIMTARETEAKKAEIKERMRQRKASPQTVLNGDVIRRKVSSSNQDFQAKRTRSALISAITAAIVIFMIVFTFMMIWVINAMNDVTLHGWAVAVPEPLATVPAVEAPIQSEVFPEEIVAPQADGALELPVPMETDASAMEEWELTDAEVLEAGVPCNGYGHFPLLFEEVSPVFYDCIYDAGYDWMIYDAFSYNQFIDEYTWYETMYEYTIQSGEERAGYINVNVDTATGEIHAIEVYSRSESGFYEVADIALKFIEQIGMGANLPAGIDFYEEALKNQQEEMFSWQYGLEVVAHKPDESEEFAQYHMSVYTPGYYTIAE